jgi:hypothetical protein
MHRIAYGLTGFLEYKRGKTTFLLYSWYSFCGVYRQLRHEHPHKVLCCRPAAWLLLSSWRGFISAMAADSQLPFWSSYLATVLLVVQSLTALEAI